MKELAAQTNTATEDIRNKISAIQHSSDMTIEEIKEISTVMDSVNAIVVKISDAIEEQAGTTKEITSNVGSVSKGIEIMTNNLTSATELTSNVSQDISQVNLTSDHVQTTSSQIEDNSKTLDSLAGDLQELVKHFRV